MKTRAFLYNTLFFLLIISSNSYTQQNENVNLIGKWEKGPCEAVDVVGNIAYFANGVIFEIVDFTNPENPVELGKLVLPDLISDIVISGIYAFVADGNAGLRIIDISDPADPKEISSYTDFSHKAYYVAVNGNYAYVLTYNILYVINITNPSTPQKVSKLELNYYIYGMAAQGNYVYLAAGAKGIGIISVVDPENPSQTGFYDEGIDYNSPVIGIDVSGNYAFTANWEGGMMIINIANPFSPSLVISLTDEDTYGIMVNGDYIYAHSRSFLGSWELGWGYGIHIIDISDINNPKYIKFYQLTPNISKVVYSNDLIYVANSSAGLHVIDVTHPYTPEEVGEYVTGGNSNKLTVNGNYAYVAGGYAGLVILDISDPENPIDIAYYKTGTKIEDVAVKDNYAYLAGDDGMYVIDISNPANLTEIGFFKTSDYYDADTYRYGYAQGIAIKDNYAYVAIGYAGLVIVNINVISDLVEAGHIETYNAQEVFVDGNYAYVADNLEGLDIINVSNPNNPVMTAIVDSDSLYITIDDVAVNGNYAYVADRNNGLSIINISDPVHPVVTDLLDTLSSPISVTVKENYVYVGSMRNLYVLDVSNIDSIKQVGYFEGIASGIGLTDKYIVTANQDYGVSVLKFDIQTGINDNLQQIPSRYNLSQNYPNPFNPSTTIKYSIPVRNENFHSLQTVTLKVYDVLGREVTTLINKQLTPGNYEVQFDASELKSGIYFYRLVVNSSNKCNYTKTRKMILLK